VPLYSPGSDVTDGGWTTNVGGTNLSPAIDEEPPSDADYIQSSQAPSGDIVEVKYVGVIDPQSLTGHVIRYRIRGDNGTKVTVAFVCGTTIIKQWIHDPAPLAFTEFDQTLSQGEAASIADYSDLRLRLIASLSTQLTYFWNSLPQTVLAPVVDSTSWDGPTASNGSYASHLASWTPPGTGPLAGITWAWNGAAFDYVRGRMHIVCSGGHNDSWNNQSYAIQLPNGAWTQNSQQTPWPPDQHVTGYAPTYQDGTTPTLGTGYEVDGSPVTPFVGGRPVNDGVAIYWDGRPASRHVNGGTVWLPDQQVVLLLGGSPWYFGTPDRYVGWFFPDTGVWTRVNNIPHTVNPHMGIDAVYDDTRGVVFWQNDGGASVMMYDPQTDTHTKIGPTISDPIAANITGGNGRMGITADGQWLYLVYGNDNQSDPANIGYNNPLGGFVNRQPGLDPSYNNAILRMRLTGNWSVKEDWQPMQMTGDTTGAIWGYMPGMEYDPDTNSFVFWAVNDPNYLSILSLDSFFCRRVLIANGTAPTIAQLHDSAFGIWGRFRRYAPNSYYLMVSPSIPLFNITAQAPGDTTPPTVSITSPTSGTVTGTVSVQISASDASGIASVSLSANGSFVGSDSTAPFTISWDTTTVVNGSVQLVATATDASPNANAASSAPVTVTVNNASTQTTVPVTHVIPLDWSNVVTLEAQIQAGGSYHRWQYHYSWETSTFNVDWVKRTGTLDFPGYALLIGDGTNPGVERARKTSGLAATNTFAVTLGSEPDGPYLFEIVPLDSGGNRVATNLKVLESLTCSGTVATAQKTAHGFTNGQKISIMNAIVSAYNGTKTITSVPDANHFTYTVTAGTAASTASISASSGLLARYPAESYAPYWMWIDRNGQAKNHPMVVFQNGSYDIDKQQQQGNEMAYEWALVPKTQLKTRVSPLIWWNIPPVPTYTNNQPAIMPTNVFPGGEAFNQTLATWNSTSKGWASGLTRINYTNSWPASQNDHRPCITSDGIIVTENIQGYTASHTIGQEPEQAILDGSRGMSQAMSAVSIWPGHAGGIYGTDPYSFFRMGQDGVRHTFAGLKHRDGYPPPYWETPAPGSGGYGQGRGNRSGGQLTGTLTPIDLTRMNQILADPANPGNPQNTNPGIVICGDWDPSIPVNKRFPWESWGFAFWMPSVFNHSPPNIDLPPFGFLPPHTANFTLTNGGPITFHGPVAFSTCRMGRILKYQFFVQPPHNILGSEPPYVTEFVTGLVDPWGLAIDEDDDDGSLPYIFITERQKHRISVYSAIDGSLIEHVLTNDNALADPLNPTAGGPYGYMDPQNRRWRWVGTTYGEDASGNCANFPQLWADVDAHGGILAPEGVFYQDGWIYYAAMALNQVRRVSYVASLTGVPKYTIQVCIFIKSFPIQSKWLEIKLSDGSFGPRSTIFTTTFDNQVTGYARAFIPFVGPDPTTGNTVTHSREWIYKKYGGDALSGGGGMWDDVSYPTGVAVNNGRIIMGSSAPGLVAFFKTTAGLARQFPAPNLASVQRGSDYYHNKHYSLIYGRAGWSHVDVDLPWGENADMDAYLREAGHLPKDVTNPAVTITAPANGATVGGTVTITANPTDNATDLAAINHINFYAAGKWIASDTDPTGGWTATWDTTKWPNGSTALLAAVWDSSFNMANSPTITVTVNN
jgi:hypothetical protein